MGDGASDTETWVQVPGYPAYSVSSWGRFRRGDELRALVFIRGDRATIAVSRDGKRKRFGLDALLAELFIGAPPRGFVVHHRDLDPKKGSGFATRRLEWSSAPNGKA